MTSSYGASQAPGEGGLRMSDDAGSYDTIARAEYLFEVLQGLIKVARSDPKRMAMLIYLLEMAAIEADSIGRRPRS